ncbi:MAG: hypothetical protein WCK09_20385 [Bacteroidota bacterium]
MRKYFCLSGYMKTVYLTILFLLVPCALFSQTVVFKDILANVYYISKAENAYQCFYHEPDNRIEFFHATPVDSLYAFVNIQRRCLFSRQE